VLVGTTEVRIHQDDLAAALGEPRAQAVGHKAFARAALAAAYRPDMHV